MRWGLLAAALALTVIGLATVHSASAELGTDFFSRQLVWVGVGLVAMVVAFSFDYHTLLGFSLPLYVLSLVALALVLVLGYEAGGAQGWFRLGSIGVQPSEFAKLVTALYLARYLAAPSTRQLPLRQIFTAVGAGRDADAADRLRARSRRRGDVRADGGGDAPGLRRAPAGPPHHPRRLRGGGAADLEPGDEAVPAPAGAHLPGARHRPAGRRLPGAAVEDRRRLGRARRPRLRPGDAESAALPAGAPHRLHPLGARRGMGFRRRRHGAAALRRLSRQRRRGRHAGAGPRRDPARRRPRARPSPSTCSTTRRWSSAWCR